MSYRCGCFNFWKFLLASNTTTSTTTKFYLTHLNVKRLESVTESGAMQTQYTHFFSRIQRKYLNLFNIFALSNLNTPENSLHDKKRVFMWVHARLLLCQHTLWQPLTHILNVARPLVEASVNHVVQVSHRFRKCTSSTLKSRLLW